MLNFREKVREIILAWNEDMPDREISEDFADYSASILRDAAEEQFSDGFE